MGNRISSFRDLDVYQEGYALMIVVNKEIIPLLPKEEKFDLGDQLRRSTKAIPRLTAEGFAKKFQVKGFQKYLFDVLAEVNETIVGLEQARDLYSITRCEPLIDRYDKVARQTFNLMKAWDKFKSPLPNDFSRNEPRSPNNE